MDKVSSVTTLDKIILENKFLVNLKRIEVNVEKRLLSISDDLKVNEIRLNSLFSLMSETQNDEETIDLDDKNDDKSNDICDDDNCEEETETKTLKNNEENNVPPIASNVPLELRLLSRKNENKDLTMRIIQNVNTTNETNTTEMNLFDPSSTSTNNETEDIYINISSIENATISDEIKFETAVGDNSTEILILDSFEETQHLNANASDVKSKLTLIKFVNESESDVLTLQETTTDFVYDESKGIETIDVNNTMNDEAMENAAHFCKDLFYLHFGIIIFLTAKWPFISQGDKMSFKFMDIKLGHNYSMQVPSYGEWNLKLVQYELKSITFKCKIPVGVTAGIYAGRNRIPSHTKYDFTKVIGNTNEVVSRKTRSHQLKNVRYQSDEFMQHLEPGNWFITIFNDESEPNEINNKYVIQVKYYVNLVYIINDYLHIPSQILSLKILNFLDVSKGNCENDCFGRGTCINGTCVCENGFSGECCEFKNCPLLCSGNGKYVEGQCVCNSGWSGKECESNNYHCDCSGQGECVNGVCECFAGYTGVRCEKSIRFIMSSNKTVTQCLDPTCSGNGKCKKGVCVCKSGYEGINCETIICNVNCGVHGYCDKGECVCNNGWTGKLCDKIVCDHRCHENGMCFNGSCVCPQGWNGKHCTLSR
ncbi:type II transmembrane protein-like protein [Leptotrombidium deliense]|uniref:Type II transmembrane protein-like protein n=1 Tax=Leptotrombidium deliense TaxID=299467 RepID=A0A443S8A2_9ACAR|nr:type II transmembrane protein-like protein [Leptotrombidium deliense]